MMLIIKRYRATLLTIGALTSLGITLPSCPGQTELVNRVNALEARLNQSEAKQKSTDAELATLRAQLGGQDEIRKQLQVLGAADETHKAAILNMDRTVKELQQPKRPIYAPPAKRKTR